MFEDSFQERYVNLNEFQKRAVDSIEGPVMVVAGPGTGKTEVLAMRVANILRKTHMNPHNILALTFTESGVVAMRKRLITIIGTSGYHVPIFTFHAFCKNIIDDWPEKFLFSLTLDPITDIEKVHIIRKIIDQNQFNFIKPYASPYHYQRALLANIQILKQENIFPDELDAIIKEQQAELEARDDLYHEKGRYKGAMKGVYRDEFKNIQRNKEVCSVYRQYQSILVERGKYDYEDMILMVTKKLEEDEDLRLVYQERYQYILVDEYQDTNNAQNTIIRLLGEFYEQPNIFVVGDDDQSIYRFQGASLENILTFRKLYPKCDVIILTDNYRSIQTILDASHNLIEHNTERLSAVDPTLIKRLRSRIGESSVALYRNNREFSHRLLAHSGIKILSFPDKDSECTYIARSIKELLASGIPANDIVILHRNNEDIVELTNVLSRAGIPFVKPGGANILDTPLIREILELLRLINDPFDETLYFPVLHFHFIGCHSLDVLKVFVEYTKIKHSKKMENPSLFTLLRDNATLVSLGIEYPDSFLRLTDNLLKWHQLSRNKTFIEFLETVLHESGIFASITHTLPSSDSSTTLTGDDVVMIKSLNLIRSLFDNVSTIGTRKYPYHLGRFVEDIAVMEESGIQFPEQPLGIKEDAIQIMTAHKSKGLEFSHVFVIQCYDRHWGNKREHNLIKLPPGIVYRTEALDPSRDQNEDERRLFYVAMTRAKTNLYFTYAKSYGEGKETIPSMFLSELEQQDTMNLETEIHDEEELLKESFLLRCSVRPDDDLLQEEKDFMCSLIKNFVLTVTSLQSYLTCPRQCKYNNIIRIPSIKTKSSILGSCVHRALQLFINASKQHGGLLPSDRLISFFLDRLQYENLTEQDYIETSTRGKNILSRYYEHYAEDWNPLITWRTEYSCSSVFLDDIPLKGVFDRIDFIDKKKGTVKVVDYKTGKPRSRNEIMGNTKNSDGHYYQQLIFYKLLTELQKPLFPFTMVLGEIDFLESKDDEGTLFIREVFEVGESDLREMKQVIRETWNNIKNLVFPKKERPDSDCDRCPYDDICWACRR